MLLPMRGMIRWVRKMKGCRSIKLFGFGAGRLSLAWGRYLIHMVYIKAVGGLNCTLGIEGLIQKYIRISVDLSLGENGAKLFASKVEFRLLEVQSKKQRLRRHLKSMIWLPEKRLSSKCWEGRREGLVQCDWPVPYGNIATTRRWVNEEMQFKVWKGECNSYKNKRPTWRRWNWNERCTVQSSDLFIPRCLSL